MFSAEAVSLHRHGRLLLDQVSLVINPGEVLAVIGPNGAGKSTLLKVFANEYAADSGQISLNGRSLREWSSREQATLRSILPQSSQLTFPFKVHEVVMMGRSPYQSQARNRHLQIIERALAMAQVEHLRERTFTTLSGGERQRVQLARVLAQIWPDDDETTQPPPACYLLLDEPTSALDLPHQHHVLAIARQLANTQNMGIFVVLHDLNLAAMYADRVAVLKDGRLLYNGSPAEVLNETRIKAVFDVEVAVLPHPQLDCPLIINHGISHANH